MYSGYYGPGAERTEAEQKEAERQAALSAARDALMNLHFELRKYDPDMDRVVELRRELANIDAKIVSEAFDEITDRCGW